MVGTVTPRYSITRYNGNLCIAELAGGPTKICMVTTEKFATTNSVRSENFFGGFRCIEGLCIQSNPSLLVHFLSIIMAPSESSKSPERQPSGTVSQELDLPIPPPKKNSKKP
jgi:hypothetical protein